MEALSWESQFNKNKHWICRINLVFIHRTNNMSWFCRDNDNNNNGDDDDVSNKPELNSANCIEAINTLAMSVAMYSFNII